jgi:hypothetical protein
MGQVSTEALTPAKLDRADCRPKIFPVAQVAVMAAGSCGRFLHPSRHMRVDSFAAWRRFSGVIRLRALNWPSLPPSCPQFDSVFFQVSNWAVETGAGSPDGVSEV